MTDNDTTSSAGRSPSLQMSRRKADRLLDEQMAKGQALAETPVSSPGDLTLIRNHYYTWDDYNSDLLRVMFDSDHFQKKYARLLPMIIGGNQTFAQEVEDVREKIGEKLRQLDSIKQRLDLYASPESSEAIAPRDSPGPPGKAVFIIHGHDRTAALELQRLVEMKTDLDVVLMDQQPHGGRVLIQKFEEEAADCGYAIAVFTPDDIVARGDEDYAQMRPNVVFELGWFAGRLGRERTCILYKEPTEMPSDLQGVGYYKFHESVEEVWLKIEAELRKVGLMDRA